MGALPKNKITRVEQGKRRRGNAPKLVKDLNTKAPLHKQGFMAEFLRFIGVGQAAPVKAETKTDAKETKKTAKSATPASQQTQGTKATQAARPTAAGKKAAGKTVRKAQHKG